MPEIRLELPGDLVRKLDTEVDLLGFDDREAYLRWIVGNRAAIEGGTERDQLLSEYQSRVEELEAQLEAHDGSGSVVDPRADASGGAAERSHAADGSGGRVGASDVENRDSAASPPGTPGESEGGPGTQSTFANSTGTDSTGTDSTGTDSTGTDSNASESNATESRAMDSTTSDSTVNSPGSRDGSTTVDAATDDGGDRDSTSESGAVEDASSADSAVETAAQSTVADLQGNFRPERVERFEDESLGSQASQLQGVEGERLDEFARRAVAKTRERLGREPTTGLDYRSQTRISRASSDVRPGEDLVDLDSLDVPGRSEDAMAPRREAVGAALAYLRDVGRAKRGDFLEALYADYPAGYDSKSGWWRCVKRGLKDAPVVEGGDGSRVWRYVKPGSREGELLGGGPTRVVDPE